MEIEGKELKKLFVALALIILIISAVSSLSISQVKADTSDVKILSYSWYVSSSTEHAQYTGDLIVVGEVQNIGTNAIENVIVGGQAYNISGGDVSSGAELPPYIAYLGPGQKAPFYLEFSPEITDLSLIDPNWASLVTNVTVRVVNAPDSSQSKYAGLTISTGSISNSTVAGTYTLTGTVENTGTQTTGRVWVIATFYNATGTVISMNYTEYISQSLLPGRSAVFTATPIDNTAELSSKITSYSLLIQSEATPTTTPTPTVTTTPTIQPSNSPTSSSQTTPTPTSFGISSTIIYIVIIAVAIVLVILAVLMLIRRRQNAEFDLPPPPPPI
jgi:hypothetical protein